MRNSNEISIPIDFPLELRLKILESNTITLLKGRVLNKQYCSLLNHRYKKLVLKLSDYNEIDLYLIKRIKDFNMYIVQNIRKFSILPQIIYNNIICIAISCFLIYIMYEMHNTNKFSILDKMSDDEKLKSIKKIVDRISQIQKIQNR